MMGKGPSVKNIHLKLYNREKKNKNNSQEKKKKKKKFIFGSNILFRVMCY